MTQPSRTVLIVDDSSEDCELYRRYLQRDPDYSYRILEASLGQQGLELWQQQRPDLVLLDYRLPDLDGLEFLAQLPSPTPQPCLPVVVMTSQGNETIAVQAMKAGVQDYLVKEQITPERLHLAVSGAIETVQFRTELQQRIEREHVVGQITRQIHQSLDLERILQTTVTEVRQFLKTDRVLVFQLQPDGNGTVVTESVGADWQSLLSSTIYDPCLAENFLRFSQLSSITHDPEFVEDYVKRYRQGQVTAISDIYSSDIDPCHVELLAQFQVKANLVVPIQHDDLFWGLLIAHHCAAPRLWQPLEIDLLKELATQLGIALRQAELYQQSQMELVFRQRVEAELRESEERLRSALEASRMGTWDWNIETGQIQWSGNLEVMFGLEPGAFDGSFQMFSERLHPDDRDRVLAKVEHAIATGEDYEIEFRVVYPNGRIRWALSQGKVFYDRNGQPVRMAGNDIDITDRKRSEQALRESEERFRTSVDTMLDCFAIYKAVRNEQGEIVDFQAEYINDAGCAVSSMSREQHLSRGLCELLPGHRTLGLFDEYCRVVETGQPVVKDSLMYEDVFGEQRLVKALDIRVAKFGDGYIATWRDVTERKQTEAALRENEQMLRLALAGAQAGSWDWEIPTGKVTWSPENFALYGVDPATTAAGYETWYSVLHPDDREAMNAEVMRVIEQRLPEFRVEFRVIHPQLGLRWIFNLGQLTLDDQGNPLRLSGITLDFTDRRQSEMERDRLLELEQAARESAERANRIKDEFLAVLSHELRSPLNPILGWAKLMQTRQFDPTKTAEALATIERNAKLQTQLIDDLLDVAKILRGKFSMEMAPVDLVFVIEAAIDTVRVAAVAKEILLRPVLPQIGRVSGDAARLQQIIWNLLSNAIKFTPARGQVEIHLEQEGDQARITVRDSGKGINPDFLPHIFESFRQEDASTTRQYGGLGLGLAIVRHLVEAHGGTIWADSLGEGQGATFTVQLPLLDSELEQPQSEAVSADELDLTGLRILSVDDEPDARNLLVVLLTQYGAEVLAVASAAEVLANLESFHPDVLISDIGMPEVDGYLLMQQIRALPPEKGGQILAIALTAYAREEDYQQAIASGYQRHLTKPLDLDQLVQAVVELTHHPTFERRQ